jgi:hypothetical protein
MISRFTIRFSHAIKSASKCADQPGASALRLINQPPRASVRFLKQGVSLFLLVLCPGCWQEITYVPNEPAKTTLVSKTIVEEQPTTADDIPIEPTPVETQTTTEVTSDELFAPTPSPTNDTEPIPVEAEFADLQPAFETPAEPVSVSSAELPTTADGTAEVEATWENESPAAEVAETPMVEILRPSRTALATWRTSSRWSLAAAIYAKGQPAESYRDLLDQATYAASLIDMQLPQFPTAALNELQKLVASYLLHEGSEQFADELRGEYPVEYASLAEFAIRSNALLLIYTPKSQQLDSVVESIRTSAINSGLPAEYWEKLIGMLDRREPFADVKGEILAMHASIGDYLSGK